MAQIQYGPPRRGGRRGRPIGKPRVTTRPRLVVSNEAPKIEPRDPKSTPPKISVGSLTRLLGKTLAPYVGPMIEAKPTAEATPGPWVWQQPDFDIAPELETLDVDPRVQKRPEIELPKTETTDYELERPELPEVSWPEIRKPGVVGISRSPKIGTVVIRLPQDYYVPAPIRVDPQPEGSIWDVPDDVPIEILAPRREDAPEIDIEAPKPQKRGTARKPADLYDETLNIEIKADPDGQPTIHLRPGRARASERRKKDTKANRAWIKAAHKLINVTYGTYSEIIDFVDALVWNVYDVNEKGELVYAMALEGGKAHMVIDGLMRGKYEIDMGQFIIDYAVMQTQDMIMGKMSQALVKETIDKGQWTSPMGPQGMLSRVQKEFQNVSQNIQS